MMNLIMTYYYQLLNFYEVHDIYKYVLIALGIILVLELSILNLVHSENLSFFYEEELHDFHSEYIASNELFPVEYRSDVNQISKVINMIKESPDKFKDIPEEEVFYIDIQRRILNGDHKVWNRINRLEKEVIITVMMFVSVMLNEVLLRGEVYKLFF